MGLTSREIRYGRYEDWEGNIYKDISIAEANSGSGKSTNNDDINEGGAGSGSNNYTDGVHTGDGEANGGNAIIVSSTTSADKILAHVEFDNTKFGRWAISIRAKSTLVGTATNLLTVNCYYKDNTGTNPTTLVGTTNIAANRFDSTSKYSEFGFIVDFDGIYTTSISLVVEIIVIKNTNAAITFDNVSLYKDPNVKDIVLDTTSTNSPQTKLVKNTLNTMNKITPITLTADGWIGTDAPFTQTVNVAGMTENDDVTIVNMLAKGSTLDTQKAYNKAYGIITSGAGETNNGSVTFYAYKKPVINIIIGLRGVGYN